MRLNAESDFETARRARVWLDGTEVTTKCLEADDQDGYVVCYVLDDQGYARVAHAPSCNDPDHNIRTPLTPHVGCDHVKTERLRGVVRIEVGPSA